MTKANGQMAIKKTEVTLRLINEFNGQDTLGNDSDYWEYFPLVVQANPKDSVFFLIGSKTNLEEGPIDAPFVASQWGYADYEKFLYPEQTFDFYYQGNAYLFRAFESVSLIKEAPGYLKKYQLELVTTPHTAAAKTYNFSKELELEYAAAPHCYYKTPQLIFVGDINKDGLPDFIYYSHTMTDTCGVCWEYHLFISDKSNPGQSFRKVAHKITCSCIG